MVSIEYTNNYSYLNYICVKHPDKIQEIVYGSFAQGHGCQMCATDKNADRCRLSFEEVKREFDSKNYTLLETEYISNRTLMKYVCNIHSEIIQTINYNNLKSGRGCALCSSSKGENEISEFLKEHHINYCPQWVFDDCKSILPLKFDFYLNDYNILVEYQGEQHYRPVDFAGKGDDWAQSEFIKALERDQIKRNYCKLNNIYLIEIPYWEFGNIEEILKCKLKIA